ncbi:MAG: acyl-CoA dehydrogenase [Rhodospirillaceae bacterium]|nr:acyl-CoA dehydrogenase [Rhodospirillaceae bacterium]|tara:strand:+ start:5832 stop:6992 length:1161 start_codon:yes stop_codon:yes gene_type:complete
MSSLSFLVDSPQDAKFRSEVRAWMTENLPDELRGWSTRPPRKMIQPWHFKLYERGWIAPHWPKEHGGMEASISEQLILQEELGRAGAPILSRQALGHIGPILMHHGTAAQKEEHLPKMLTGEVMWCQGYSEPGSGSDLASLQTRGEVDGEEIVINGHKIWTTGGHFADWMYALIRTDPDAPKKQAGISMVLIDLKTPGITIRPIMTIADDEEFAEVFFDDVRIPISNLVGELNDGWSVAKALLASERIGNANPQMALQCLDKLQRVAKATGAINDPVFQGKITQIELDVLAQSAVFAHAVQQAKAGQDIGAGSSFMKIVATENIQRIADLMFEAAGEHAADVDPIDTDEGPVDVSVLWREVRRITIYAGSSEIQRNIAAKRVLGLP